MKTLVVSMFLLIGQFGYAKDGVKISAVWGRYCASDLVEYGGHLQGRAKTLAVIQDGVYLYPYEFKYNDMVIDDPEYVEHAVRGLEEGNIGYRGHSVFMDLWRIESS